MSAPDSGLSPQERAAFAELVASVAAEDPSFVARVRAYSSRAGASLLLARARQQSLRVWERVESRAWIGAALLAVGLAVSVVSLSFSTWLGFCGAVLMAVGLRVLFGEVSKRAALRRVEASQRSA